MFLDAHSLPADTVVESDLCIVGSGAAGITIAREFLNTSLRTVLLDSGSMEFDQATQDLYAGQSAGRPYSDLTGCRLRFFGGTTNHWGGWCLPRDPIDFEARDGLPHSGWPITRSDLDPWYAKTQGILQLGPYDYRPANWGIKPDTILAPFNGPHFVCKMLQNSPPTRFGSFYAPALKQSDQVTAYLNANALGFDTNDDNDNVRQLNVSTLSGSKFAVRSRCYVLATGGIENARLLLVSGNPNAHGLGNDRDLVGRFFMVHLEYSGGTIAVADPYANFDFYTNASSDGRDYEPFGQKFVSFVGLSEQTMRDQGLPSFKTLWTYEYGAGIHAIEALQRLAHGTDHGDRSADIRAIMRDLGGIGEYGLRRAFHRPSLPVKALRLHCSSEQLPNPDSRIRLGDQRDALGMPRVVVDWNLTADDRIKAQTTQRLLGAEVGRAGLGRLRGSLGDDEAWPDDFYGDEHHIGTTRMHRDPAQGVVDENCKLHGVRNLYVAGSSVFPTSGGANSTMTIVALALRLADHLKRKLA
jgi:choline dehydrogenase-like flavoprotein